MASNTVAGIRALLIEAGAAHGVYEETDLGGVRDENWPTWYARYLLAGGLGVLLPAPTNEHELAAMLAALDAQFRHERPVGDWPDFYAARLAATEALS